MPHVGEHRHPTRHRHPPGPRPEPPAPETLPVVRRPRPRRTRQQRASRGRGREARHPHRHAGPMALSAVANDSYGRGWILACRDGSAAGRFGRRGQRAGRGVAGPVAQRSRARPEATRSRERRGNEHPPGARIGWPSLTHAGSERRAGDRAQSAAQSRIGGAERRRNRTYPPPGYDGSPVLKTGWGTSPVPLRREGYGGWRARMATLLQCER
jgi:hypothetical protein